MTAHRERGGSGGLLPLLGVTAAVLLAAAGMFELLGGGATPAAALGGPWTLVGADGRAVTDRDFRGRFLLIYFGYASCADVCPTALGTVQAAMRRLGPKAALVQPVFISVDPARDTPEVVGHYARSFGPGMIGLTGNATQLDAVRREYHVSVLAGHDGEGHGGQGHDGQGHGEQGGGGGAPGDGTAAGVIEHSSVLFLVGPDGRTVAPLAPDATPERLADRLSALLS